jgi:His-Xaa-Ser system protein HxsD
MIVSFEKQLYDLMAIKRVFTNYSDCIFINLSQDKDNYLVEIESKENDIDMHKLVKDIKNKILEEEVRINIENETKIIRDSIFKRAMNNNDSAEEE